MSSFIKSKCLVTSHHSSERLSSGGLGSILVFFTSWKSFRGSSGCRVGASIRPRRGRWRLLCLADAPPGFLVDRSSRWRRAFANKLLAAAASLLSLCFLQSFGSGDGLCWKAGAPPTIKREQSPRAQR